MPKMTIPSLTAIILTKNEELHIARCIGSLKECAERVVIVDSFSTDKTVDLARSAGADVYQRPFHNYADQFNWALKNCNITSLWTMRIDADEYVDADLSNNISKQLTTISDEISGVVVTRYISFLGRIIRHGGVSPQKTLKIWRTGFGQLENRWMDEHTVLSKGGIITFSGALIDDNQKDISFWIAKHNRYAIREMIDFINSEYHFFYEQELIGTSKEATSRRIKKKSVYNRVPLLYRAIALFLYRYIFRLGFLDGKEGLSFALLQTLWYRYIVDLKIMEARAFIGRAGLEAFRKALKGQHGFQL
jgi:glycosyltransferase involved in cell wall biosynthesis